MRWVIAGGGAVGSWIAGNLAAAGDGVCMTVRGAHGDAVSSGGLRVRSGGANGVRLVHLDTAPTVALALAKPADAVLVCVKSYDTHGVADEVGSAGARTAIVSFQNGVGNEAILAARLPGQPVFAGTLTTPVQLRPGGEVWGADKGGLAIAGSPSGSSAAPAQHPHVAPSLAASLTRAGLKVRIHDSGNSIKWSKLLLNIIVNATCGLLQLPPEKVIADRRLFHLERRAWLEAVSVMRHMGVRPVPLPSYPVPVMARLVPLIPAWALFPLARRSIGGARAGKWPGIAQDLAGRRRTEIGVLNGAVTKHGHAPVNRALTELVEMVERDSRLGVRLVHAPEALLSAVDQRLRGTDLPGRHRA